ncbi:MAG: enoyl-CoA hydratase [Saprospiraceae bacterium]|jgi:enoyl-CoA hydratase
MSFENITLTIEDQIALIKIDRPKFLNALNKQTILELSACFGELETNDSVHVIIIAGEGEKAFVAGADIKEFISFDKEQGKQLSREGQELLFSKVDALSKPVIAAINGFALGGGLELAMSCHIRLASENAKLGLPELSLGLIPGYGGTQRLMQLIGKGRALELMLSSNMVDAEQALRLGLVNHVYSSESLLDESFKLAHKIARNSSFAVAKALKAVQIGSDVSVGLDAEVDLFGDCFGTDDFKEGTSAFLEKRKPNFK